MTPDGSACPVDGAVEFRRLPASRSGALPPSARGAVIIPAHNRNFAFLLSTLQSAIIHAERRGDTRGTFDLSFDGNVIIR